MSYKRALAITTILFLPLMVLLPRQYSGDGIVYSESILKNELTLNPNHLLVQPIGKLFNILIGQSFGLHPLDSLKILSLMSSFITVFMFVLLFRHYDFSPIPAYLSMAGFAYSSCFLMLFDSSEILIVQMPILLGMYHLAAMYVRGDEKRIYNVGFTLGLICSAFISIAVYITNVFIVIGVFAALYILSDNRRKKLHVIYSFIAVVFISLSTFYAAWTYFVQYKYGIGFIKWIASYSGSGKAEINSYGASIQGYKDIITRLIKLYYGLLSNIFYLDLGPLFKSIISSTKHSDSLGYGLVKIAFWVLEIALLSVFGLGLCIRLFHILGKNTQQEKKLFLNICIFIIISTIPFNFYWNNTDDQFWIQILPAWWLATAILMERWSWDADRSIFLARGMGYLIVSLLLINNLIFLLWPRHEFDSKKFARRIVDRIEGSTIIIWPGHDRWEPVLYLVRELASNGGKSVETVSLMTYRNPGEFYEDLDKKMMERRSVNLLRIIDGDEESTPWDTLNKKGFYRSEMSTIIERNYKISDKEIIFGHTTLVGITERAP